MTAKEATEIASSVRDRKERDWKEQLEKEVAPLITSVRESIRRVAQEGLFQVRLETIDHDTSGYDEVTKVGWIGSTSVEIHPSEPVFVELLRILKEDGFDAEIGLGGLYVAWGSELAEVS
jgi:hypothetical protein